MNKRFTKGFTLLEVIAVIFLFALIVVIVSSFYISAQRIYTRSSNQMEIVQNARVVYDRVSREIRQSDEIVTSLASSSASSTNEIFFENGHNSSKIDYIYYYQDNNNLRRAVFAYYFSEEPNNYVRYNSTNEDDEFPQELIVEDKLVGEYVNSWQFWGKDGLINVYAEFEKNNQDFHIFSSVFSRNY